MCDPFGYVNQKGDTIVKKGRFQVSFTDTIITYGAVIESETSQLIGINVEGKKIYEIHQVDNGADYLHEGLFRILQNGRFGYANQKGIIKIKPSFECAYSFKNGRAKVAKSCDLVEEGEHQIMKSKHWFYIDKSGNRVDE